MLKQVKTVAGLPISIARKMIADPIVEIDDLFADRCSHRRSIKLRMNVDEHLDDSEKKTKVEEEVVRRLTDKEVGAQAWEQLLESGHCEIVLVLKGTYTCPSLNLKVPVISEEIRSQYASPIGIEAEVHLQGVPGTDRNPCVVVSLLKIDA